MFGRKKEADKPTVLPIAQTVPKYVGSAALALQAQTHAERSLYAALRRSVPVIDAALGKIVRLLGTFRIVTDDPSAQAEADRFAREVRVNGSAQGLAAFVWDYMDCLLTYGEAVGEMLLNAGQNGVYALYNADPDDVRIIAGSSPMELLVCRSDSAEKPLENQSLLIASLLGQKHGTVRGTSLLEGLPFVSEILLRILQSIKNNWERAGDLRFAVTYDPKDGNFSEESARLIADEWKKAMRGDSVCDFVSVGDVRVRVIGAENQMPDCQVPVRVLLEQIVAKLGIPPFLLGFSWSSTEHMSVQQADILTSELLRLAGYSTGFSLVWNDINLQDAVELSQARLNNARAAQLEKQYGLEVCDA